MSALPPGRPAPGPAARCGQKYMEECTEKIREVRELIEAEDLDVDVPFDLPIFGLLFL